MSKARQVLHYIHERFLGLDIHGNVFARSYSLLDKNGQSVDVHLPLTQFRNADGSALATSAPAAGNMAISSTVGTSLALIGEAATSNTKTDSAILETPATLGFPYSTTTGAVSEQLKVTINANFTGAGTSGAASAVGLTAYMIAPTGVQTALTVTPPAVVAPSLVATDFVFSVATQGGALPAGSRILLRPSIAIQETAGVATTGRINSIRVN